MTKAEKDEVDILEGRIEHLENWLQSVQNRVNGDREILAPARLGHVKDNQVDGKFCKAVNSVIDRRKTAAMKRLGSSVGYITLVALAGLGIASLFGVCFG